MRSVQSVGALQGLGGKLALTNLVCVLTIVLLLVGGIAWGVQEAMRSRVETEMNHGVDLVRRMVESNDRDLRLRTEQLAKSLSSTLKGDLTVQPGVGEERSRLLIDGVALNGDLARMERFTQLTGAVATVFVKQGTDYWRVTTSLRNEKGEPAVGTKLDVKHPAYARLNQGQPYMGLATLFGRQYMTHYQPMLDTSGQLVGVSFIGQDFSELMVQLKTMLRELKVGESGYYYVLRNAENGPRGTLVVHPSMEGQSLWEAKDSHGNPFVQELLERKQGVLTYDWKNPGESVAREKIASFTYYEPWDWEIVSSAYVSDFVATTRTLLWSMAAMGLVAVLVLAALWWGLVRRMIVAPVAQVSNMAQAMAQGDLTVRAHHHRHDELGQLLDAMNQTADGLSKVVQTVQQKATMVAATSAEIAQGNMDLATRTENSASALAETASAMEELGSTLGHNAAHARSADQLTREAQRVVTEGGSAVREVVDTMQGIDTSSQKIADIISVIDSIAFQTNILALNAAVEAARAGEQGRGFAVVAGEVRALAGRSAEAAKEIKQLISASMSEIQQGNERAARAGSTMEQAISEIQKVAQLISDISHASEEQLGGVSQVADAVGHMDKSTQQNSALVEEMAGSADSLRQQAEELRSAVSVFRVQGGDYLAAVAESAAARTSRAVRKSSAAAVRTAIAPSKPAPVATGAPAAKSSVATAAPATQDNQEWESF